MFPTNANWYAREYFMMETDENKLFLVQKYKCLFILIIVIKMKQVLHLNYDSEIATDIHY